MADTGSDIYKRIALLQADDRSEDIYDEWAQTYEDDLQQQLGYVGPQIAVEAFHEYNQHGLDLSIMDYGCGTGLVGVALHQQGYTTIDGLDISVGMLAEARAKNVYQALHTGDLTATLDIVDATYDAAICVGIFGNGHVGPENLGEIVRTVKPNGLIVLCLNELRYTEGNYPSHFDRLETDGVWTVIKTEKTNYIPAAGRLGRLVVARVGEW